MNIYAQHESAPESQLLIIESEESKIASFYTGGKRRCIWYCY